MDYNWKKLNFPEKGKLDYIKKYISDLKLRSDDEDFIYYHDVVFKIIVRQIGSQVDRENPENILILKTEKKIQEKIKKLIERYIGKKRKKEKGKIITIAYNPLTSQLYYKTSYVYIKAFLDYYKENIEFLNQLEEEPCDDLNENLKQSEILDDVPDNTASNIKLILRKKTRLFNDK